MDNELMQDAGTKWFGDIPASWKIERIKDIVATKITDGPHETPTFSESGIPFISAEAIKDNKIDFDKKRGFISQDLHESYSKKCKPQKFDIFIIKSGATTGNVAYVDTDIEFNIWSPLAVIRCKPLLANYKFIYYQLLSDVFKKQVEVSWSFGTQENIGMGVLGRINVSLPPVAEQQAIAHYLDQRCGKLDAIIAIKQQQIKTLDALRQSIIYQAVTKGLDASARLVDSGVEWLGKIPKGWHIERLKDIANINENSLEAKTADDYVLKYIEISNVNNLGIISGQAIEEIEFAAAPSRARRKVAYGETIISSVRPNLQAIAYIKIDEPNLVCSTGFYVVAPKPPYLINQRFLYFCLLSESSKQYFESVAKGVGYPAVDDKEFKAINLVFPTTAEQQSIIHYLDRETQRLDQLKTNLNQQINTLEAYKKSLIYECVTGKKRVVPAGIAGT